jgi:hypothetical protein
MAELHPPESVHERRITWSLIAVVIMFVMLMTCIVIWITSSLIRQDLRTKKDTGNATASASTGDYSEIAPATTNSSDALIPGNSTPVPALPTSTLEPDFPVLMEATWTPVPGPKHYVRFLYWFARPSSITVGECVQITWETEFAVSLQLYRNDELILEDAPPSATLKDCPAQVGYAVYKLVGSNSWGDNNFIQLQVKVKEAP